MAQMTTLDAGFLRAPDPDQQAGAAAGAVAVVNGSVPDYELIKDLLGERIQPGSDVTRQVHRMALPLPGDETELFRAIAYALEHPLDLSGPPWECWIIEGLADDQWAILMKVHQSVADEISPAELLARLCDDVEAEAYAHRVVRKELSAPEPPGWADALWQAPANVVKAAARAISTAAALWPALGPQTTMRRYRTVRVPRAAVDSIARKFGVTADDVALAAITEGFRTVLVQRGEQPRADSLRTLGPVLPYLPVQHHDPIRQLRAVHTRVRETGQPADFSPLALCTKIFQALTRLPQQGIVTLATNAPGPQHRLRLLGQRMERLLPIPPTAMDLSTGVSVLSYGNDLIFGITADYDATPEIEQLAAGIELGMARLTALSENSVLLFDRRRKRPRALPNSAARWRPPTPPARVRH